MDDVDKQAIYSVLRQVLGAVGTILIAHGVVNTEQWANLLGVITITVPVVWGIYDKYAAEKKTQARVVDAYNAGQSSLPPPTAKGPTP